MMSEVKENLIMLIIVIIFGTIALFLLANYQEKSHGQKEWISPDGVHYWVYGSGYGCSIAPRFDNNGNLVIDKQ